MELSRLLREHSRTIDGKQQLVIAAYARAFELIPRQLADNAGFDATDLLNRLRQKHATEEGKWWGVDIENEGICDTFASAVWEPASSKINSVASATEAACLVLSVDETVKNPSSQQEGGPGQRPGGGGRAGGMGGGQKISTALGGGGMSQMVKGRGVKMMQGRGGR